MSSTIPVLDVPVFAGQGTTAASSPQTRQQALRDAVSPAGSLLLSSCFESFHNELSTLSPEELGLAGINLSDFSTRDALLQVPSDAYLTNSLITGTTLFLIQSLRYLTYVETSGLANGSLTPFSDVFKRNLETEPGVLGFSSGILPAVVAGSALSTITFISRAVEAYRLALWIGVRTQIYKTSHEVSDSNLPWSLVFLGMSKEAMEAAIMEYCKDAANSQLYVTAVVDDRCITVSGHPDSLAVFANTLNSDTVVHKTSVDGLYHCPIHTNGVKQEVLADVARRNISFPNYSDILVPVRSTFTGSVLDKSVTEGELVEAVIDMILTQPVNWNLVVGGLVHSVPADIPIRLLNIGPGTGLTRSMERAFPGDLASSLDLSTINSQAKSDVKPKQEPIAIVGMAVNMPGARDVSKLWEVLEQGINTIAEVPEHRFKVSDYNNPKDPNAKRQMKAHTGNFIDGVDEFDNKFFKISPREARSMDPQQRILLHTAYEALENAGYVPGATPSFQPETFGCYIGVATHDYLQNLRDDVDVYYSTGTLKAFLSGRISYAMQLSGPSIVVDTACSSSAVSVYQGCRALMNGDCNAAMVGGVNVISSPDMMIGLDRGHFLSPTGQCKAFDASADGYSRSEGCGIFVLKRLSDAVAENDNILGVIRGIEVNQSGLAHSITHPHAPTQATLFKRVLANSGIQPTQVTVVEAHGTGTQAGDPNELESIRSIFAVGRSASNPLHITSVKANIGHLEAASGAAGLAKLLLMLRHSTIPKQISLKHLNPKIAPLETDHTIIDRAQVPWNPPREGATRIALLNNFGAAGSNTAMLLEEFTPSEPLPHPEALSYVFGMSAKTESALIELRSRYIKWLESADGDPARLGSIAYTMTARRQIYSHRIAVQASTKAELVEKLSKAQPVEVPNAAAQVVFVFSGQGGQYLGMGQVLYQTSPLFKQVIDECESVLISAGFPGVLPIINPGPHGSGLDKLKEFEANQAAIFSLEYALAKLWMSWGLKPVAVVGHSLGEYAALVTANVLSLKGALMIVASRVRLMMQKCAIETTGMIAINLGSEAIDGILASSTVFSGLSIACYNSATDSVVSGPLEEIRALKAHLDTEVHCKNVLLSVPFGYHSSAMVPLLDELVLVASRATIRPPSIPVISNVYGNVILPGDPSVFNAEYFARHCAEPVRFDDGVSAFISVPTFVKVDAWLEIGPHTTTLPMLKANPSVPKDTLLLGSLRKQQDAWFTLSSSLSQLYSTNVPLAWREVFAHVPSVQCIDLPLYALARNKFWVKFKESEYALPTQALVQTSLQADRIITEYSMLHSWAQYPDANNGHIAIFETPISQLADRIKGHSVGGVPLCPASVYLEQVLAGLQLAMLHLNQSYGNDHPILRRIEFAKPLVYDADVARTVVTTITLSEGAGSFTVSSSVGSGSDSVHVHGEYRFQPVSETVTKFSHSLPVINRQMKAVLEPKNGEYPEVFSTRTAYEVIFPRVVDYSKEYHTMRSLTVDPSGMEGYADVKLPSESHGGKYVAHPVFMDTLLHVAGFVANMQGGVNDAYICSEVKTVKVLADLVDNDASYAVYCNNAWLADEGVMLAEAYAVKIGEPKRIVAHLKGMAFRRVRLNSLKKGLLMAAGKAPTMHVVRTPVVQPQSSTRPIPVSAPTFDVHAVVLKLVSETCDISIASLDINTDLTSLGVDSLMSIEIFGKLQAAFPAAELSASTLSHCSTVSDIVREVSTAMPSVSGPLTPSTTVASLDILPSLPTANIQGEVLKIVSETCGVTLGALDANTDLNSLGVDSLMSIEIFGKLQASFPQADLNAHALTHCSSVADIVREVTASPTGYDSRSTASSPSTLALDDKLRDKLVEPPVMSISTGPDIKQLLASVLDISLRDIADDADFESLGLDSLTSIEAIGAIKTEYGLDVPSDFFMQCSTARAVEAYISTQLRHRA